MDIFIFSEYSQKPFRLPIQLYQLRQKFYTVYLFKQLI